MKKITYTTEIGPGCLFSFAKLFILLGVLLVIFSCKTQQRTKYDVKLTSDSTAVSKSQLTQIDSTKTSTAIDVKINGTTITATEDTGRKTEIELAEPTSATLKSILDGTAPLKILNLKITENKTKTNSVEKINSEASTKEELTNTNKVTQVDTDSVTNASAIEEKLDTEKESKMQGGFGFGFWLAIGLVVALILLYLYFKFLT